jgi:hypothetical protein
MPVPGVPWLDANSNFFPVALFNFCISIRFWNDWGRVNECSLQGPSPLFQSFNQHLRSRWKEQFGPESLQNPPGI